ncbi:pseudouridine synthase-like protein TruD/Pus7 [Clohesyomyces aquaticus]|uniref:Pseudouridine synthase-like protein TruD/Pus7 n=1 Tax=Clohesyomyces aquaticus TaxID=1231657 RepID=A0A1Y1ZVR4_9PLEO|nr:pseudouridine synthase-like protein TruD/Pus7 [Clohesyomyces aquaticus]
MTDPSNLDVESRPAKRPRLDESAPIAPPMPKPTSATATAIDPDVERELKAGITEYINPNDLGFSGVLKQRYTDFLVNEILPSGRVLRLMSVGLVGGENEKKERGENGKIEGKREEKIAEKADTGSKYGAEKLPGAAKEDLEDLPVPAEAEKVDETSDGEKPTAERIPIPEKDLMLLYDILTEITVEQIELLVQKLRSHPDAKGKKFDAVVSKHPILDKGDRTTVHETLRRVFPSLLESSMDPDQRMRFRARPPMERGKKNRDRNKNKNDRSQGVGDRLRGKVGWEERGGEYLHFTLYKENKDTMEVIGFMASKTSGMNNYGYAGTKDRRACSVQRVSVKRQTAERMIGLGRSLWNSAIGDFEYQNQGLDLGDLAGNEFTITLRDCHFENEDGMNHIQRLQLANQVLSKSVLEVSEKGFINYFGLQRFGSFSATTDSVGQKLLRGDFEAAIDDILVYSESAVEAYDNKDPNPTILVSQDDRERAKAIRIWKTIGDSEAALRLMPKRFSAERNIIQHLGSKNKATGDRRTDYQGALRTIQRRLLTMYVHAYQSLVWNVAAGKRWTMFGGKVVEGDLVLVREHKDKEKGEKMDLDTVDQDGEIVINPSGADSAIKDEDRFERARPLSKDEAESGKYTAYDVVLPQPGFDVEYPKNAIGDYYKEFMASERGGKLDPYDMRRKWKDVSLSGGYRKFLARPLTPMEFEVKEYVQDGEQLVETDLQRVVREQGIDLEWLKRSRGNGNAATKYEDKKLAVILKLQLGSSQYATMALRELMKKGVKAFQPEYMGGRS